MLFVKLIEENFFPVSEIEDLSHLLPREGKCVTLFINTKVVRVREYADGSGMWEAWACINDYWGCESECPKFLWDDSDPESLKSALSMLEFVLKVLHN